MRSAFCLACIATAVTATDSGLEDVWDMADLEEEFAVVERAGSRALIGCGPGSAGTKSCVTGDDATSPDEGESNSPGCWCDTSESSTKPCKVYQTSPKAAYFCRSKAIAAAFENIPGQAWATSADEMGVSDCTIKPTPAPTAPPTPRVVPTPPTPAPTPAPTPTPTFAPGSYEVKTPTTLTGFTKATFTIGVQYAYRKAFAMQCEGSETFTVDDVTLYGDLLASRRLTSSRTLAADSVEFTTGLKVENQYAGQRMQEQIKNRVTSANIETQMKTELAAVIASKRFPDLEGKDADTLTAELAIAKSTPELNQIPVPTPAPPPPADKTGAIVGGICGGLILAGIAYKLNERAKLNPHGEDDAKLNPHGDDEPVDSAVAHQGQL